MSDVVGFEWLGVVGAGIVSGILLSVGILSLFGYIRLSKKVQSLALFLSLFFLMNIIFFQSSIAAITKNNAIHTWVTSVVGWVVFTSISIWGYAIMYNKEQKNDEMDVSPVDMEDIAMRVKIEMDKTLPVEGLSYFNRNKEGYTAALSYKDSYSIYGYFEQESDSIISFTDVVSKKKINFHSKDILSLDLSYEKGTIWGNIICTSVLIIDVGAHGVRTIEKVYYLFVIKEGVEDVAKVSFLEHEDFFFLCDKEKIEERKNKLKELYSNFMEKVGLNIYKE